MRRLSFAPASSRIVQRLAGYRPLESCARDTIVVCKGETEPMRPAVCLPGELERITGVHEFSAGLDDELHLATRDQVRHTETLAYRLQDVCLANNMLCNFRSYRKLTFGDTSMAPKQLTEVADCVAFCSTAAGNDYFAHFLLDDLATALLGQQFARVVYGGARNQRTAQMTAYRNYLHIAGDDLKSVYMRDVWLFTDHAQNSHRRARLQAMRATLADRFGSAAGSKPPAYIRRGMTGHIRQLENEAEIEDVLGRRGFAIIDPEALAASEICTFLNGCPLVVGVEGSQLAHGIMNLMNGGTLLCIQPAARFNAVYRGFTNTLGLHWAFTVADGPAGRFRQSTDRLLATIDLAMGRL